MHGSTFELDTRASTHLSQAPNPHNSFVSYVHGNNIARQYQMCSLTTAVSRLAPSAPCFSMSAKLHNTDTAENNYSSTYARTHARTHTHTHTLHNHHILCLWRRWDSVFRTWCLHNKTDTDTQLPTYTCTKVPGTPPTIPYTYTHMARYRSSVCLT